MQYNQLDPDTTSTRSSRALEARIDQTSPTVAAMTDPLATANVVTRTRQTSKEMREDQRRTELEEDKYAMNLTPNSVQCTLCLREIRSVQTIPLLGCSFSVDISPRLDNRIHYQCGNWKNHRKSCNKIKAAEVRACV